MPLSKKCSMEAFEVNLRELIRSGRSREQAYAIAMDVLREACHDEGKPMPKKTAVPSRQAEDAGGG